MSKAARPQYKVRDEQAMPKFIEDRITSVEKHFADLCSIFAAYTRKTAGLRDKGDEVAKAIQNYAKEENVNTSLKNALLQFSDTISGIGDFRDAQVQRTEYKVVSKLSQYEAICKQAKGEVKKTLFVKDRERSRKRQLDMTREQSPRNRQQISMAESQLLEARSDVSCTVKTLAENVDMLEKRKLNDIRVILLNHVNIELSFHVKAIELFTKAYQDVAGINVDEDLEAFRSALRVPESVLRPDTVKRSSIHSPSSYLAKLFITPPAFISPSASQELHRVGRVQALKSLKKEEEDSVEFVTKYEEDEYSSYVSDDDDDDRKQACLQKNLKHVNLRAVH